MSFSRIGGHMSDLTELGVCLPYPHYIVSLIFGKVYLVCQYVTIHSRLVEGVKIGASETVRFLI
jgi:hypothetical protein